MKTLRRKYRYATREAAEQAAVNARRETYLYWSALNAMVNGTVQWLPDNYGDSNSYYRFGLVVNGCEPVFLITHFNPVTRQKPRTTVLDEQAIDKLIDVMIKTASSYEDQNYRNGLMAIREHQIVRIKP